MNKEHTENSDRMKCVRLWVSVTSVTADPIAPGLNLLMRIIDTFYYRKDAAFR